MEEQPTRVRGPRLHERFDGCWLGSVGLLALLAGMSGWALRDPGPREDGATYLAPLLAGITLLGLALWVVLAPGRRSPRR